MDLILWRHADAEAGGDDLARALTQKGRKQAAAVGAWLKKQLPSGAEVIASPARRARETADALKLEYRTDPKIAPGASVQAILKSAGWPKGEGTAVIVGHQPDLGAVLAHVLAGAEGSWSIKKGGLWWLSNRERDGEEEIVVRAVLSPDLL